MTLLEPADIIDGLLRPPGRRNPYPLYEQLRAHGPLVPIGPSQLAAVGYAECSQVLREPGVRVADPAMKDEMFPQWRSRSSTYRLGGSLLMRNPPDHTRLRRLVSGAFTARRVAALRPAIAELTDRLLDRLADLAADGAPVDFLAEFAFRLPVAVIGALLGVPDADRVRFRAAAADLALVLDYQGPDQPGEQFARADAAMDQLVAYFVALVAERRAATADDLVSDLVRTRDRDGDRLSENELIATLVLLLFAGFETTTNLLGSAVMLTFDHPEHAQRLRSRGDDGGFAAAYVEEVLRYDPPVQLAQTRYAETDLKIAGALVPAGTAIEVFLAAANRDPRRFARPERFDPGRPDNRPLTFGGGVHYCLGAPLARLEAEVALPRLLRRFPHLAPAGVPAYNNRLVLRGLAHLPVGHATGP